MIKLTNFQIISIILGLLSIIITLYIFLKSQGQDTQKNGSGGAGTSPAPPLLAPGEVPPAPGGPPPVDTSFAEIFWDPSGSQTDQGIIMRYYNQINQVIDQVRTDPQNVLLTIHELYNQEYISQFQAITLQDWLILQGP